MSCAVVPLQSFPLFPLSRPCSRLLGLNSRNSLLRTVTRALLWDTPALEDFDQAKLHMTLAVHQLRISLPPHPGLVATDGFPRQCRRYSGGPVVLVSDGSASPGRLGWGAVIADDEGPVAYTSGGIWCATATSWAAEWLGRYAVLQLADLIAIPPEQRRWVLADNVAASVGADGGRPSGAAVIDAIRLAVAESLGHSEPVRESLRIGLPAF